MNSFPLSFSFKTILPFVFFTLFSQLVFTQVDFEILSGDAQICVGDSTLLSIDATVDSIRWSPTNGVSMPEALTTFVRPSMSTTYFATLYFNGMTEVVPIQVNTTSEATLGNDVTVCSNGGMLMYDFTDLSFPGDYVMSNSNGFAISELPDNVFSVNINNTPAGTYDLIVSNPDCNQSDTIQVTVVDGEAAELNLTEEDRAICLGDMVSLSVPAVFGQTYTWSINGNVLSPTNSVTNTPIQTTTYIITTTGATCSVPSQDSLTITVNNDPAITLPETIDGCENDTIQLGNNIAQAGTTYSWSPTDNIVDPSTVNAELLVVEDGMYVLTANNGCEIKDTILVTMIENDIELADTIFVCKGDAVTIPFTTNPPNDDVVWTTIDGAPLVDVPTPFTVTPEDVISYIATVENNGCTFMDTVTLQVDSLPMNLELTFIEYNNTPAPVCVGDTVQITSTTFNEAFFPNIEYQWLINDNIGGVDSEFLTPDSLFNVIFTAQETKIYGRIATNGACIDTVEVEVPVVPILEVDVTPQDEVCPNSIVMLTGTATDPLNGNIEIDPEDVEWEWVLMPGTIEPAEGMGENTPTASVGNSTAQGMVTATYLGCPSMGDFIIPVALTPQLSFPNAQICIGDEVMLNSATAQPTFIYQWESTANDLAGQENDPNPTVNPIVTTTYSVTVTNSANNGDLCDSVIDQVTVEVFDSATGFDNIIAGGCEGEEVVLAIPDNVNAGPNPIFTWTPQSGGASITAPSITVPLTQDEVYIISLTNSCESIVTFGQAIVTSNPIPPISLVVEPEAEDNEYGEGQMLALTVEPVIAGATYTWTSTVGASFTNNPSPSTVYTVPNGESDRITVFIDLMGCPNASFLDLTIVEASVVLPNIFTPGQAENAVFSVPVKGLVEIMDLVIFDRWGNKVYENDNVEQEWDGTINGKPAPSEVYIYTVTYQIPGQDPVVESRDLTLLR